MERKEQSVDERLTELRETAEAVAVLAEDEEAFRRAVEAFRAQDAARFQAELATLGLFGHCRLICRWLCSKHCMFVCVKLCGLPKEQEQLTISEMHEFAMVTKRIGTDEALLERFVEAVDHEDAETFGELVVELKIQRFCHQLCHWLYYIRCRIVCRLLCTPPLITKVSYIPTSKINPQGYGAGPSNPPGTTPDDNKTNGVGDHPFGGLANIRGAFSIAGRDQYKVEFATDPKGPWTPILQPVDDYTRSSSWPTPPFDFYTRVPTAGGWYNIAEMGWAGADYLTDWPTPTVSNDLYYLKLTVRTAALTEYESPVVPVRIDNGMPTPEPPMINLQLQKPDGTRTALGCCEEVEQGNGNLVVITLKASDPNFSKIRVRLLGGCGGAINIVATDGTRLTKTYNGIITDTGYPVPTEFLWDPWAAGVDPCCYLVYVDIWDRTIVDNSLSATPHYTSNWRSITIA
jgi:hypothetical protein